MCRGVTWSGLFEYQPIVLAWSGQVEDGSFLMMISQCLIESSHKSSQPGVESQVKSSLFAIKLESSRVTGKCRVESLQHCD